MFDYMEYVVMLLLLKQDKEINWMIVSEDIN